LDLRQVLQHNHRNFAHALRTGRPEAPFTSNDPAVRPNENWIYEAEFPDRGGDLRHLLGGVGTGVGIARDQPVNRPALDLDFESPHKFVRQAFPARVRLLRSSFPIIFALEESSFYIGKEDGNAN
jgi:hypothetical protein